ncbi:MAG: pyridoxamine 5'-phosphate oxidase family protein [Pseudomonadales bacterium]
MVEHDERAHPAAACVWHRGERQLQIETGVAELMQQVGPRVIRPFMPQQHRDFYAQLNYILLGSVDGTGLPWASYLVGEKGFIHAGDEQHLAFSAMLEDTDPGREGIYPGAALGFLGIEPHTRRRNRVNGRVGRVSDSAFALEVQQSMGNCPKYIHRRSADLCAPNSLSATRYEVSTGLSARDAELICRADTFYVASYYGESQSRQVDVSHRGGVPGFVQVLANGTLRIPDFAGNKFFCTLGNIVETGLAGLTFYDDASSELLQLSGAAALAEPAAAGGYPGAERVWLFEPHKVVRRHSEAALSAPVEEYSPYSASLGPWR